MFKFSKENNIKIDIFIESSLNTSSLSMNQQNSNSKLIPNGGK